MKRWQVVFVLTLTFIVTSCVPDSSERSFLGEDSSAVLQTICTVDGNKLILESINSTNGAVVSSTELEKNICVSTEGLSEQYERKCTPEGGFVSERTICIGSCVDGFCTAPVDIPVAVEQEEVNCSVLTDAAMCAQSSSCQWLYSVDDKKSKCVNPLGQSCRFYEEFGGSVCQLYNTSCSWIYNQKLFYYECLVISRLSCETYNQYGSTICSQQAECEWEYSPTLRKSECVFRSS